MCTEQRLYITFKNTAIEVNITGVVSQGEVEAMLKAVFVGRPSPLLKIFSKYTHFLIRFILDQSTEFDLYQ